MKRRSTLGSLWPGNLWLRSQGRRDNDVPDVNKDPRYLMCFASTRSEIVMQTKGRNGVLGEIDIYNGRLSAFNQEDRETLEGAASLPAHYLDGRHFESHDPSTL